MHLGILMTARCNASCGHCSTSCGPRRTEHLRREEILDLIDQASVLSGESRLTVCLSGGEVFLDYALLLEVVAYASRQGAEVTCVTNGYWATSRDKALALLIPLKKAGLSRFSVSASSFHDRYIKRCRVERILNASLEIGLPCSLKYVRTVSDPENAETIRRWALATGATDVEELPLLPHLRDGEILPDEEYPRVAGLPEGPCPGAILTIRENGEAYTCGTPGAYTEALRLGNVREESLDQIREGFYFSGMQQLLRTRGPIHFAHVVRTAGIGHCLRDSYADICDLCTHIQSDPQMAAVAARVAEDFEQNQAAQLLGGLERFSSAAG